MEDQFPSKPAGGQAQAQRRKLNVPAFTGICVSLAGMFFAWVIPLLKAYSEVYFSLIALVFMIAAIVLSLVGLITGIRQKKEIVSAVAGLCLAVVIFIVLLSFVASQLAWQ